MSRRWFGPRPTTSSTALYASAATRYTASTLEGLASMKVYGYGILGLEPVELVQVAGVGGDVDGRRALAQRLAPDGEGRVWEYVPAGMAYHPVDPCRAGSVVELANYVGLVLADAIATGSVISAFTEDRRHFMVAPAALRVEVA